MIAGLLLPVLLFVPGPAAAPEPADPGGVRQEHLMIPMRDGTRLSAYLTCLRVGARGRCSTNSVTPTSAGPALRGVRAAAAGGTSSLPRTSGAAPVRGDLGGLPRPRLGRAARRLRHRRVARRQPWSTGKVGTFGGSQAGYAKNFLAVTRPRTSSAST